MTRVFIAIPSTHERMVPITWGLRLGTLEGPAAEVSIHFDYRVDENRNGLVRNALETDGITHILWWDDDIRPPHDGLNRLLAHQYPVCSGVYVDRQGRCSYSDLGEVDGKVVGLRPTGIVDGAHVAYADATGLGFCLMDVRIFKRLTPPWFVYETHGIGEDFYLCKRLKDELRMKVLVDGSCRLGHGMSVLVDPDQSCRPVNDVASVHLARAL